MLTAATLSQALFSLVLVIGLILLSAWLLRAWQNYRAKLTGKTRGVLNSLIPTAQSGQLEILEVRAIDFKRKLVLVRRGGVLHLLLCGDGRDIVIETAIPHDTINANPTETE